MRTLIDQGEEQMLQIQKRMGSVRHDTPEMAALQADRKALDAQIEAIEQRVKMRMGDTERASGNRWRVDWKNVETRRLDSKRLQAQLPDVYRQYTNIANSRRFRVTFIREKE